MPDRLPPNWGHGPADGRDLNALLPAQAPLSAAEILADEAVLSGQVGRIPDAQRPVAGALSALRAAPGDSELAGEAAARAAFRALITPGGSPPGFTGPAPGFAAPAPAFGVPSRVPGAYGAASDTGHPGCAERQDTLVFPVPAAGPGPRRPARHRRRGGATGRGGWRAAVVLGSAAAAVAIGAASLAGVFHGSPGQGRSASSGAAQSFRTPASRGSAKQSVLGRANRETARSAAPTPSAAPHPTPSQGASPAASDLCHQFYADLLRHSPGDWDKDKALYAKLSKLAGSDDLLKVADYCASVSGQLWTAPPQPRSWAGTFSPGGGNWQQYPGSGRSQASPGQAVSGPGDSSPRGGYPGSSYPAGGYPGGGPGPGGPR